MSIRRRVRLASHYAMTPFRAGDAVWLDSAMLSIDKLTGESDESR